MTMIFKRFLSPQAFYRLSGQVLPWAAASACIALLVGTVSGLFLTPADYQQGDAYRIIYLHVPAAMLSLLIYSFMSVCAGVFLIWRIKVAALMMRESAAIGALFTAITLITGSIWGKPMWGTWWIWDARLTSELILLFLYLGTMILQASLKQGESQSKVVAIWVLVGFVDIPIIHFSVQWWTTLHQGYSFTLWTRPKVDSSMLYPLAIMWFAFLSYFVTMLLVKTRSQLLRQDRHSQWVKQLLQTWRAS